MITELIRFEKILRAVDYPVAQEDLVNFAVENGADEGIIEALQNLPNHAYVTPNDVFEALSNLHSRSEDMKNGVLAY